MKKTKTFNWTFLSLALVAMSVLLFASVFALPTSSAGAASTYAFSNELSVTVQNRDNQTLQPVSTETATLKYNNEEEANYSVQTFNWADVRNFVVSFNTDSLVEANSYSYSYSVSWTPAIITDGVADFTIEAAQPRELINQTVTTNEQASARDQIVSNLTFAIDNLLAGSGQNSFTASTVFSQTQDAGSSSYDLHGGWGLYIFSFNCNDSYTSAVFQILPTDVSALTEQPSVTVSEESSQEGMQSAYLFFLNSECQFINRDYIVWSIEGTGRDGLTYVLTPQDITDSSLEHALTTGAIYRNGPSYFFDTEVEGTWTAVCRIYDEDPDNAGAEPVYTIRSAQVSTSQGMAPNTIVWIVVGVAAAAAIIVGIVVGVSIKKERVY